MPSPPIPGKDGKTIFATGRTVRGELSRFDSKTGQFLPFLGGISAEGVSFSKDGRFIAYVSWPEGVLWKANRDGSNPVQLTDPPIHAYLPCWSSDGSQILFTDIFPDVHRIYVVPTEGGSPQRLLPEYTGGTDDPTWSADGRKVVFATYPTGESSDVLRILDRATHQVTIVPGSAGTFSPRWSPDGQWIVAIPNGAQSLKVFDTKTQQWSEVLKKFFVNFPRWSRDSHFIYFTGDGGVYRIPARGGKPELVAETKDIHKGGTWGWTGLDPTNAPLLLRDEGSDDIYALTLEWK